MVRTLLYGRAVRIDCAGDARMTILVRPGSVRLHWRRMQKTFGAVYENGVLRPLEPLRLAEHQCVSLTIDETPVAVTDDDLLDHELLSSLENEELPEITLEAVRAALAKIPGSMTAVFAAEREERF